MAKSKKIIEKGLSLIEASMVLALAAVVTSAALYYFSNARINQQVEQTSTLIVETVTKVQTLYQGKPPASLKELTTPVANKIVAAINNSLEIKEIQNKKGETILGYKLPSVPGVVVLSGNGGDTYVPAPHFTAQFYFDSSASESFKTELCNSVLGRNWGSSFYGGQAIGVNDTIAQRPRKDILSACASPDVYGLTLAFLS